MNNPRQFLSLLALGAVALAGFSLANTEFAARLPLDTIFAAAVSLGLIQFAFADYSHRLNPLSVRSPVLRPGTGRTVCVSAGAERAAA